MVTAWAHMGSAYFLLSRCLSGYARGLVLGTFLLHAATLPNSASVIAAIFLLQTVAGAATPWVVPWLEGSDQRRPLISNEVAALGLIATPVALGWHEGVAFGFLALPLLFGLGNVSTVIGKAVLVDLFSNAKRGNAILYTGTVVAFALGPLSAAVLLSLGTWAPLAVAAGLFALAAGAMARVPRTSAALHAPDPMGYRRVIGAVGRLVSGDRLSQVVLLAAFLTGLLASLENLAIVFVATEIGADLGYGIAQGALQSGLIVGSALCGVLLVRQWAQALLPIGLVLVGLSFIGIGVSETMAVASMLFFASGVGNAFEVVTRDALLLGRVRHQLATVMAFQGLLTGVGALIAYGIGPILIEAVSARGVFTLAGAGILVTAGVSGVVIWRQGADIKPRETAASLVE